MGLSRSHNLGHGFNRLTRVKSDRSNILVYQYLKKILS
jgi:hypothetical protein